jgi:hypothetical protein
MDMTEEQEETRSIWKTIKGSEELFDLYGYYPTLHDASVTNFHANFERKEIVLTFEYSDLVENKAEIHIDKSLATQIMLCWERVSIAQLLVDGNHISHLSFQKIDDKIETKFSQSFGIGGQIIAESIKLISVEASKLHSLPKDSRFLHTIQFGLS